MEDKNAHIDELISKLLVQGLDNDERKELDAWMAQSEENRKHAMQRQEIWFSATGKEDEKRYDQAQAFEAFKKRTAAHRQTTKMKNPYWKSACKYAAAIAAIGLISYFSYRIGETNLKQALTEIEVEAPLGSQTRLRLPDSTLVFLNAGSRIVYAQNFGVDKREVRLSGEGYFEVTHNAEKPFMVTSKDLQVRVLGTKFNICDYPEDSKAVVSLIEGKVALDNRIQKETEMILLPNEQMTLNKEERRMKKEIKTASDAKKWTTGQLFFDETPLIEVAKTLERSYNTQITFGYESLKECLFCGSFNRTEQNIKDILEALRKTGKIHYTIDNKNITLY